MSEVRSLECYRWTGADAIMRGLGRSLFPVATTAVGNSGVRVHNGDMTSVRRQNNRVAAYVAMFEGWLERLYLAMAVDDDRDWSELVGAEKAALLTDSYIDLDPFDSSTARAAVTSEHMVDYPLRVTPVNIANEVASLPAKINEDNCLRDLYDYEQNILVFVYFPLVNLAGDRVSARSLLTEQLNDSVDVALADIAADLGNKFVYVCGAFSADPLRAAVAEALNATSAALYAPGTPTFATQRDWLVRGGLLANQIEFRQLRPTFGETFVSRRMSSLQCAAMNWLAGNLGCSVWTIDPSPRVVQYPSDSLEARFYMEVLPDSSDPSQLYIAPSRFGDFAWVDDGMQSEATDAYDETPFFIKTGLLTFRAGWDVEDFAVYIQLLLDAVEGYEWVGEFVERTFETEDYRMVAVMRVDRMKDFADAIEEHEGESFRPHYESEFDGGIKIEKVISATWSDSRRIVGHVTTELGRAQEFPCQYAVGQNYSATQEYLYGIAHGSLDHDDETENAYGVYVAPSNATKSESGRGSSIVSIAQKMLTDSERVINRRIQNKVFGKDAILQFVNGFRIVDDRSGIMLTNEENIMSALEANQSVTTTQYVGFAFRGSTYDDVYAVEDDQTQALGPALERFLDTMRVFTRWQTGLVPRANTEYVHTNYQLVNRIAIYLGALDWNWKAISPS